MWVQHGLTRALQNWKRSLGLRQLQGKFKKITLTLPRASPKLMFKLGKEGNGETGMVQEGGRKFQAEQPWLPQIRQMGLEKCILAV